MSEIAILLVDDHPIVREGYRSLLERQPGCRVVAEADNAASAYQAYRSASPNLVIMDLSLPGAGGLEAVRHIRQWDKGARILVFTMHSGAAFALKAFEAGASGYVTKSSSAAELVRAVGAVAKGGRALSNDVAREIAAERLAQGRSPLDDLGPRETEILKLVAFRPHQRGNRGGAKSQHQDRSKLPLPDQIQGRRADRRASRLARDRHRSRERRQAGRLFHRLDRRDLDAKTR